MKIIKPFILLGILLLCAITACSGPTVPQGAQKIGHYEGSFTSAFFSGSCQMDLYRLADGSGTFEGSFQGMDTDDFLTLKGTMTGNHLEGTVQGENVFPGSTISGDLSSDENVVRGIFSLKAPDNPKGTWSAKRK